MRKIICLGVSLLVFLLYAPFALAQSRTITGTVMADDGKAMQGVTITVRNTQRVTTTNEEGAFSISAITGESLVFSYVGYQPQTVVVGAANTISVVMAAGGGNMEEVIVVGYGTQKRGNVTGSVTNVNMESLANRPIADAGRGLQGVVPGLSVRIPSGEVGSDPLMRIRGFIGSINPSSSSAPLILVDNVEIPSIQMINPNDIESITILKDAAASSIYGAKAAFGVILITTKRGSKSEGVNLSYSNNFSIQSPAKKIEIAGIDGLQYTLDAHKNMKQSGPAGGFWRINDESLTKAREWQEKYGNTIKWNDPVVYGRDWIFDGTDKYGYRVYDPVAAMVKENALTQNHNISVNGRSGGTRYNASFGYLGQEGMMEPAKYDDFNRYTANLGISTQVTKAVTIRGGVLYSDRTKRYANSVTGFGADPWLYLYRWSRLFPTGVLENGEEIRDPYWDTKKSHTATLAQKYTNLNFGTTIDFTKNWNLIADYTYDTRSEMLNSGVPAITAREPWYTPVLWKDADGNQIYVDENGNRTETGGVTAYEFPTVNYITKAQSNVYRSTLTSIRHTINAYSTYNLNINRDHQLKFMLGTNIVAGEWNSHFSRRTELINNDNPQFPYGVGTETSGGDANWDGLVGYFSRINYAYDNKYLLEGNLRYDGTSKFPEQLKWKWYPSFSAGWIASNEEFMKNLNPVLSYAKFRGSWGSIGDQSVANSLYMPVMDIAKNSWLNSAGNQFFYLGAPDPVSPTLTWQEIVTLNVGAEFRFFNNKFGANIDLFERQTQNMIIRGEDPPATSGGPAPLGNFGNLSTKGWELALDFRHRLKNGLGINITANLSDAVTDIVKSNDWTTEYENRLINGTYTTGKRYGDIYGYVTDRLYQKEDFVYDANGNHVQENIIWQGTTKRTNKLAGKNPVYQTNFEDGNQILLIGPGDVKFVDVNGDGYITPGNGTFGDPGDRVVIGNIMPRYEYGFRVDLDYKSFDLSIMGQGVGKRHIWGDGQLAIPGYHVKDGAMPQAIAEDYWREDRTDAFYPRAWNLNGASSGFVMVPQTRYLLDMSYFRIKNITMGYNVAPKVLDRVRLKQARIYVSLENMITFDNLRGLPIDPEAISGVSMFRDDSNYNLGRTGTGVPTFKIASVGLNVSL